MTLIDLFHALHWLFLFYFISLNASYLFLNFGSLLTLNHYIRTHEHNPLRDLHPDLDPPISILVPAYNEEATIAASLNSLLQLNYTEYEIVVINDGSSDRTLQVLLKEFGMVPFPEAYRIRLPVSRIRRIYHSTIYPNLRLIDKDNGGKADALNAGINAARYPLFCGVDADSVLDRNSLKLVVQPFLEDTSTVACGGTVRIANGCEVKSGYLIKTGLPRNLLGLFQIVEYLRAFLFGRLGWSSFNALLVISGAFGLFHKETVVEAGGYRTDTVGEDMELVVRLHRKLRLQGKKYRIQFVPDPICWTEVPEDMRTLRNQRIRWQRGLAESLFMNIGLLFHPRAGATGWLAFPFMLIFEWAGPFLEVFGYGLITTAYLVGILSTQAFLAFLMVAIGFGFLLSVSSLFMEELSYRIYGHPTHLFLLLAAAVLENLGYRQLISVWRLMGLIRWLFQKKGHWGTTRRSAAWHQDI